MSKRIVLLAWLSAIAAVGSSFAADAQHDSERTSDNKSPARSLAAIQRDVQAALRAEAISRRAGPNVPDVMRLIELYREMAAHPQHDTSDYLADVGLSVRSRLKNVAEHIEQKTAKPPRATKSKPVVPATVAPEAQVLAQQIGVPGGGQPGQGVQPSGGRSRSTLAVDYGPELVEIIQAVISPATWDINGGRSTIVYYAPLHVLVVSAPDDVHPQISNLLGQLRAAP